MDDLYFAYGSNLDPGQMQRRCPDSKLLVQSHLTGHELRFVGYSRSWDGGVATIYPCNGHTVHGLLYRMGPRDFDRLDRHEGGYERRFIEVPHPSGTVVSAQTYFHLEPDHWRPPSATYAAIIAYAHGRMGIDPDFVKQAILRSAEG